MQVCDAVPLDQIGNRVARCRLRRAIRLRRLRCVGEAAQLVEVGKVRQGGFGGDAEVDKAGDVSYADPFKVIQHA